MPVPVEIKLKLDTKELMSNLNQSASRRMLKAANEVRTEVLKTLSGSRSGRTYTVPGTKRTYTASAPGEAPAQATSDLRKSVKASVEGKGLSVLGKVKATASHALPLEFGTRRMAPRPFMKPSLDRSISAIKSILSGEWI